MVFKAAIIQAASSADPQENLCKAERFWKEAAEVHGASLVVFPEYFMCRFSRSTSLAERHRAAEAYPEFVERMCALAKQYGTYAVFGAAEPCETDDRIRNTVVMTDDTGTVIGKYRKTHLYDAFSSRESDSVAAGDSLFAPVDTKFGKIGIFVCYELRFPEVAATLRKRGAELLILPTAWVTGEHKSIQFEALAKARAIENGVYLIAADQCGGRSLGESIAVDPMGAPLARAGETECVLPFEIDTERVTEVRAKLPSFEQRRPELYEL